VLAPEADLPDALAERYGGRADRLSLYRPFTPGTDEARWRTLIAQLREPPC